MAFSDKADKVMVYVSNTLQINITKHKVLKNLGIYTLKILNLDNLKFFPSKNLQHGLLQDEDISKVWKHLQ